MVQKHLKWLKPLCKVASVELLKAPFSTLCYFFFIKTLPMGYYQMQILHKHDTVSSYFSSNINPKEDLGNIFTSRKTNQSII